MNPNEDLWAFSLRVYAGDGVASACLWLQDHRDVDVNVLLYCCWLGGRGVTLDNQSIAMARQVVAPWAQAVVQQLRTTRRWIKEQLLAGDGQADPDYVALRESIKAAELEAERLQQRMLAQLPMPTVNPAPRMGDPVQVTADNSVRYLMSLGAAFDATVTDHLAIVVAAASGSGRDVAARAIASSSPINVDDHE